MSTPLLVSERPRPQITTRPLSVGCLIFPQMDQIAFTGPFEVLSHMPDTTMHVLAKELAPVRDVQGLRPVTTHWAMRHLTHYYGAVLADARVVADGNIISAAGVTPGLDAALVLVSFLRAEADAQEIQLAIEYAPNPVFHSESPDTAPGRCCRAFRESTNPLGLQGRQKRFAMR